MGLPTLQARNRFQPPLRVPLDCHKPNTLPGQVIVTMVVKSSSVLDALISMPRLSSVQVVPAGLIPKTSTATASWVTSQKSLIVDTDGDGKKDAIWFYLGHRPIRRGAGYVLPLFAFKVVDLDGKINLNTAGNLYDDRLNPANPQAAVNMTHGHYSHHGASQAEINPKHLGLVHPNEIPVATSISPLPFAAPLTLPRLMGWNVLDIVVVAVNVGSNMHDSLSAI